LKSDRAADDAPAYDHHVEFFHAPMLAANRGLHDDRAPRVTANCKRQEGFIARKASDGEPHFAALRTTAARRGERLRKGDTKTPIGRVAFLGATPSRAQALMGGNAPRPGRHRRPTLNTEGSGTRKGNDNSNNKGNATAKGKRDSSLRSE
jgi:hypothetical protein